MHGFRDNEVLLQGGYDVIVISPLRGASSKFSWRDSERANVTSWLRSIPTFYLGCIISEIMSYYCKPAMTLSWFVPWGGLLANFNDGFWKSDLDFLMTFHCNFLSGMHGFRDKQVLLLTGYDVIVISRLRGALRYLTWQILKERPWLPDSVSYQLCV